ncbi:MAG: hypothetical protein SOY61_03045, partial [Campylobacter sp.]|nr:hypothetical protein [Campylobacter sp.]
TNNETAIDLTKLNNKVVSGDATALTALTLDNVGSGATVTLNKDDGIAETIKLAANAKDVTITGIAAGDKLDLTATSLSSVSGTVSELTSGSTQVANNKAYFMTASSAIDTASAAAAALSAVTSFASGNNALIAFNNGGKSYLFKATGDSTSTSISASELTLIGIVDNEINASDKVENNGVITFA